MFQLTSKFLINNYDKIANYYDSLSRLVFGKSQLNAQINQLKNIKKNSSILIVGGGTGWILEEIGKRHPSGLKITYVEISAKMLALSKDRDYGANSVLFIHSSIEDFNLGDHFNIILTPFLLTQKRKVVEKTFFKGDV
ncbi:MAG: methyltransferase domain-containing protein [Pedobacter sp.]|nr:MAG: methyltransferase domain-containing protein [Pedobacter sp.]